MSIILDCNRVMSVTDCLEVINNDLNDPGTWVYKMLHEKLIFRRKYGYEDLFLYNFIDNKKEIAYLATSKISQYTFKDRGRDYYVCKCRKTMNDIIRSILSKELLNCGKRSRRHDEILKKLYSIKFNKLQTFRVYPTNPLYGKLTDLTLKNKQPKAIRKDLLQVFNRKKSPAAPITDSPKPQEEYDLKPLPVGAAQLLKTKFLNSHKTPEETYDELWQTYSKVYPKYALQKLLTDYKLMRSMELKRREARNAEKLTADFAGKNQVRILYTPWEAVEIGNGFVRIYRFDGGQIDRSHAPFVISNKIARESFNRIIPYFKKRLDPIRVRVVNGEIVALDSSFELERAIDVLSNKDDSEDWEYNGRLIVLTRNNLSGALRNSQEDILSALKKKKSSFFNKLIEEQAYDKKIVPCIETLEHTEESTDEDAFIFTLRGKSGTMKIVFENENPARSTLVFETQASYFNKALQSVFDFMRSDVVNKRLNIIYGKFNFRRSGITSYYSVRHDDKNEWISRIKR